MRKIFITIALMIFIFGVGSFFGAMWADWDNVREAACIGITKHCEG